MVCILDYEGYGKLIFAGIRWKPSVVMMQTLSSPQVVVMTTYEVSCSLSPQLGHREGNVDEVVNIAKSAFDFLQ